MKCGVIVVESFRCGVFCLSTTVTDVCIIVKYHKFADYYISFTDFSKWLFEKSVKET